jgi:hypothetical protein
MIMTNMEGQFLGISRMARRFRAIGIAVTATYIGQIMFTVLVVTCFAQDVAVTMSFRFGKFPGCI